VSVVSLSPGICRLQLLWGRAFPFSVFEMPALTQVNREGHGWKSVPTDSTLYQRLQKVKGRLLAILSFRTVVQVSC
jgi:hypothetical protein